MEITKKIKESESIIIEGDKKIGKMTLALYFSKLIEESATLVSPLPTTKVVKKIEVLSESFKIFNDLENFLSAFSLREDWVSIKNEYGYKYILKDLEHFISHQKNRVMIFHKIGSLFDYSDRDFIEDFLAELLSFGITYKKKFIFTLNTNDVNYDMISRHLVDNSDLYLKMYMTEAIRNVDILYSLTPITQQEYLFMGEDSILSLKSKSTLNNISGEHKDISIVFISSNPHSQQLHKYLLDKDNIDLIIADNISNSLSAMLQNPDYLIFEQEGDKVELSACEISKQNNLNTQILYIVNKKFVRIDDRMKAKDLGCVDMIKIDENVMNYILELEKYFNLVFYKKLPDEHISHRYNNVEEFKNHIQEVLNKRGVFTLVKVKNILLEEDFSSFREYDKVLVTENYSVIFILNILKSNVETILEHKFSKKLDIEEIQDSLELFFGGKLCID